MVSLWYSCEYVPHASVLLTFPLLFPSSHLPTPICPKCLFPKWLLSILSQFESLHSEGNIINAMFFFLCLFFSVNMMSSSTHFLANDMLLIFLFGFLSLYSSALSLPPRSTSFLIKLIRMTSVLLCTHTVYTIASADEQLNWLCSLGVGENSAVSTVHGFADYTVHSLRFLCVYT